MIMSVKCSPEVLGKVRKNGPKKKRKKKKNNKSNPVCKLNLSLMPMCDLKPSASVRVPVCE